MDNNEAFAIRQNNIKLIGTYITRDNIEYYIEDILIIPPATNAGYLIAFMAYEKSGNFEDIVRRFPSKKDLEVKLYTLLPDGEKHVLLDMEN
jgi:hypothetical protein